MSFLEQHKIRCVDCNISQMQRPMNNSLGKLASILWQNIEIRFTKLVFCKLIIPLGCPGIGTASEGSRSSDLAKNELPSLYE